MKYIFAKFLKEHEGKKFKNILNIKKYSGRRKRKKIKKNLLFDSPLTTLVVVFNGWVDKFSRRRVRNGIHAYTNKFMIRKWLQNKKIMSNFVVSISDKQISWKYGE